jgi:hypothetical protein
MALAFIRYSQNYVLLEGQARANELEMHGHQCEKPWDWRVRQRADRLFGGVTLSQQAHLMHPPTARACKDQIFSAMCAAELRVHRNRRRCRSRPPLARTTGDEALR